MAFSKSLKLRLAQGLLAATLLMALSAALWASGVNLTLISPNNYPMDQCTGFCDGMANRAGWKLSFSSKGNAKDWADGRITNGSVWQMPTAGSIMVLDGPTSLGHVGWVLYAGKTSTGYTLTVAEGNFQRGTAYGLFNNMYPYWVHTWYITGNGPLTAKVEGGTTSIPVRGFVRQK
jgi:surface antigen